MIDPLLTMPIPTPHDALFKVFLTDLGVATDFLRAHLPDHIQSLCDFTTLRLCSGAFVEEDLRQHFSDMLYSVQIRDHTGYIYTLIEHQSTPDPLAPFRMLRYSVAAMKRHIDQIQARNAAKAKNNAKDPALKERIQLPLVVPLLFYHGETRPYPHSTRLLDSFAEPELAQQLFLNPYPLIDLSVIPDEEIRTHKKAALLELIQKHIHDRDIMMELAQDIKQAIKLGLLPETLFRPAFRYLVQEGDCADPQQFIQAIVESAPQYQEIMMTIAQQLRQEGEQKGRQEGEQKGRQEGRQEGEKAKAIAIAQSMLQESLSVEAISRYTGLPIDEVAELQTKH